MKIRNWHKRNLRSAREANATATLMSTRGSRVSHQLQIKSDLLGVLNINMEPAEFKELAAQFAWHAAQPQHQGDGATGPADETSA